MPVFMRGPGGFGGELAAATATAPAPSAAARAATAMRRSTTHDTKPHSLSASPLRLVRRPPAPLVGSLRGNQLPVGIARGDLARERPDVRHLLDALGIARNHRAAPVAGGRDQLAHELYGDLSGAVLQLGLDNVGPFDPDKALVDLLAAALAVGDGAGKPVVDLAAQQSLEGLAIAFGEGGDDDLVGGARALDEGIGIEGFVGAHDLDKAVGDAGIAGGPTLDALLDVGTRRRLGRRRRLHVVTLAPRQGHDLVLAGELAVALAGFPLGLLVALEAGLLMAGATPEHAAQLEKDDDRQN